LKNPQEIFRSLVKAGNEMAEANYQYKLLDDATKSILANLTVQTRTMHGIKSQAEAQSVALTASVYRDHLIACAEASRESERAKIMYYSTRSYADHCRTEAATERALATSGTTP
jgi:hypothetical protein